MQARESCDVVDARGVPTLTGSPNGQAPTGVERKRPTNDGAYLETSALSSPCQSRQSAFRCVSR